MGLKLRHDTAANWTSADPTLELAEMGYESNTGKWKVGDGTTAWTSLAYMSAATGGALLAANNLSDVVTPATARTNLGLAIGTNVQAFDADLTTIAGLTATTDNFLVSVASAWASRTPAQVKTTLAIAESDVASLVTDLGNKQPLDSDLTTIAGLTATTDNTIMSVGSAWASRTPAQVKTALAIAESDVASLVSDLAAKQPLDSDLTTIAGLTATTDNFLVSVASAWASRTVAQVKTTLALDNVSNTSDATKNAATATLTNKRRTFREYTTASTATLTPEIDTYDVFDLTAQAAALNIANHSTSTPTNFEQMRIRILDNGTARAVTYGTNYSNRGGNALPSTTIISKYTELGFEWFSAISKWVLVSLVQE